MLAHKIIRRFEAFSHLKNISRLQNFIAPAWQCSAQYVGSPENAKIIMAT
jgi:hypothetical protein